MRAFRIRQSSVIDRIAYDDEAATLCIVFRGTGTYHYFDVPAEVFDGFRHASSVGAFFNEHIKDRFRCQRDPGRRRFGPNA